ncbi:MAG TPA: decaprenyl-phosphate phosphoribosyltransferase [candidate division Zixibacteria bacterium]|nr:decaprenyl-phosphate phosphoribosyltransferase [candidate division Zixibacteria bacterium]
MKFAAALWKSARPYQWPKNFLLFAALIFSKHLFDFDLLIKNFWGFLVFCLASSSLYILNDAIDYASDIKHPLKSRRPVASGQLPRPAAFAVAFLGLAASLVWAYALEEKFLLGVALYVGVNFAYSFYFKHFVILDAMLLATGFVLRAVAGGWLIGAPISDWLVICTLLLSLFLAFSKRRAEMVLLEGEAKSHRASLEHYSPYLLDQLIGVVTASTVVAYTFYTLSPEVKEKLGSTHLYLTVPFVLFGIFRYLYLVHQKTEGGDPTKTIFSDLPLVLGIILWAGSVFLLIYK